MASLLELNNIDKIYGKKVKTQVLYGVNLKVEESSFTSIVGASGSGKSTLMNIIGALDRPTNGSLNVDGRDILKLDKNKLSEFRNETIGFIFQFHYLLPEFTVFENILLPARIKYKRARKEDIARANELIDRVGLCDIRNNKATEISGGQQQRAAIARALINTPKIILGDEPTGNLDSKTSEDVYRLLKDINEEYKSTFIVITHDERIAEKADRIIEIKDGRINSDTLGI